MILGGGGAPASSSGGSPKIKLAAPAYSPMEKLSGFGLSVIESFPEMFGIEPTERTQMYRAANPVGGFTSQALGAFVPYVGAAKLARAAPYVGKGIAALEGLGGESAIVRGALGALGESTAVELGRTGLAATGVPEAAYEAATGRDAETKPLGVMAGEGLVNIASGAALGGAIGGLAARFARDPNIAALVPDAAPDRPLVVQARSLNENIAQALESGVDPESPQLARLAAERDRRINWNLQDVEPTYTDTGETQNSRTYRQNLGRVFRPIEGEKKLKSGRGEVSGYLNNANRWDNAKPDKMTQTRRLIFDPLERGGYDNEGDLALDLTKIVGDTEDWREARQTLGLYAQDVKTIEVKRGIGKKPQPEDYASPLDWIRDKTGRIVDFYHGTGADIDEWKPGTRGGISFSMDPKFASNWAEMKSPTGGRVYVTAIKSSKLGNFKNPGDVQKAIEASGKLDVPGMENIFKSGDWSVWENLATLKKAGWDTVYMVEAPGAPGPMGATNIFVTKPEVIFSSFDPKVQWAKNIRLHATEPQWNKPSAVDDPALGRARGLQRRFFGKGFNDIGNGWRMAKEEDGLFVMAKKISGDPLEAAPGDKWAFLRTDKPEAFAGHAAKSDAIVSKSAYFPQPQELERVGEPLYDGAAAFLKMTQTDVDNLAPQAKTKLGATLREVKETARTYAQPTGPLAQRNKFFARGFQLVKHLESSVAARVSDLMYGARVLDPEKSPAGIVMSLKTETTGGLNARIAELSPKDIEDWRTVLELEIPYEKLESMRGARDINGDEIISEKAIDLLKAQQLISDINEKRFDRLDGNMRTDAAQKLVSEFQARRGHYGITREFPGAYRIFLNSEDGQVVGMATGPDPAAAKKAAEDLIEQQAKRGRKIIQGGLVDEALRDPDQVARMKRAILRPGFLKNRGNLLGYDLQTKKLTNSDVRQLIEKNLRRRESFIATIAANDQIAPIVDTLRRQSPMDAQRLEKVLRHMQGDEGDFAKAQNAVADKILASVGLSGKDSATKIVQATQRMLTSFQFNFASITQPVTNLTGMFQTLLPQIAFVVHASPETLARNYVSLPLLDSANNVKGNLGVLSEVKVFGNAFKRIGLKLKDQPEDYKEFLEEMIKQQVIAPRFAEEQLGVDGALLRDPIAAFKSTRSFVDYFNAANGLMMSKSEELSRVMTVNAAYELGTNMGLSGAQLAAFGRDMVAKVNYNYGTMDRALMFTTPIGALLGTFKNWGFHYMSSMVQFATGGKETLPALMWQTASTALIGGAVATPLVQPLANAASQFLADKNFMQVLYETAGGLGIDERVADGVMYGLPGSMGVSMAAQTASPGSDPQRDAQMIFSFAALDRAKNLGVGVRDALVAYRTTGESPWEDSNVRGELVRALAPRTLYRAMALTQQGAVRSLATGYDVSKPLGLGGAALYASGFNPVELDKTYEVYNEIRNNQEAKRDLTKELGQTMAQATKSGDDRLANRTLARAMALGVDTSAVMRSASARLKRAEETQLDFAASAQDQQDYEFMFNDDEAGVQ